MIAPTITKMLKYVDLQMSRGYSDGLLCEFGNFRLGSGARTHRSRKLPVAGKYPQGQLTARLLTDSKQSASGGKGRLASVGCPKAIVCPELSIFTFVCIRKPLRGCILDH